jgi:hypothetical protein
MCTEGDLDAVWFGRQVVSIGRVDSGSGSGFKCESSPLCYVLQLLKSKETALCLVSRLVAIYSYYGASYCL